MIFCNKLSSYLQVVKQQISILSMAHVRQLLAQLCIYPNPPGRYSIAHGGRSRAGFLITASQKPYKNKSRLEGTGNLSRTAQHETPTEGTVDAYKYIPTAC